jgi:uroporphyrinogen decarboxylase
MMRQAGRYLPEYRATREQAGGFLDLCYNPELAAEVTLQPIRRFGFDAAILFADILLVPQALGLDLWFETGEGPRLSTVTSPADLARLKAAEDVHETLSPIYETVARVRADLPPSTALIGFAGAPWTVATYAAAGRGTPDQGPAHRLKDESPEVFAGLMERIEAATVEYLAAQVQAGAQAVKIFDSWAGSLQGDDLDRWSFAPMRRIAEALRQRHPDVPVIASPRGAGPRFEGAHRLTGADAVALDDGVEPEWAAAHVQPKGCVQGNLASRHMVTGGEELVREARRVVEAFRGGPHVFNLGHGITPDASIDNVQRMIDAVRGA